MWFRSREQFLAVMSDFYSRLKTEQIPTALFYYAGHGVEVHGENYLIPTDFKFGTIAEEKVTDIENNAIKVRQIFKKMEMAKCKVNLLILDACRSRMRGLGDDRDIESNQLAQTQAPVGSYIAYATSPGKAAKDGFNGNGLYTSCLLRHIRTPNITIESMFKRVRECIIETEGKYGQLPWESTAMTGGDFFMRKK
jgi:uncharacterized caspase-like protein